MDLHSSTRHTVASSASAFAQQTAAPACLGLPSSLSPAAPPAPAVVPAQLPHSVVPVVPAQPSPTTLAPSGKGCATAVTGPTLPLDVDLPPSGVTTGAGVSIALIDTGSAHPAVQGDRSSCLLHGTAVGSVLHAVAPGAHIHSFLHASKPDKATGTVNDLIKALDKAVANGAKIVNVSMVTCERVKQLDDAVARATNKGVLIVASVGNRSQCDDNAAPYPATLDGVLAVGAVTARETPPVTRAHVSKAPGSNTNAEELVGLDAGRTVAEYNAPGPWADIYAPGGPVSAELTRSGHTATIVGDPHPFQGTSFAAPIVSATAALVWSVAPHLNSKDVENVLLSTAIPGGTVPGSNTPAAVLDPTSAVDAALDLSAHHRADNPDLATHLPSRDVATPPTMAVTAHPVAESPVDYSVPALLAPLLFAVLMAALVVRAFSAESKPPSGSH